MAGPAPSMLVPSLLKETGRLASLGFPIVISLAAATLIGVVDTIMVAPLGTLALAGVSITGSFMLVFYAGLYGFVSVVGVRMAEAHGRKSAQDLSRATLTGLIVSGTVGVLGAIAMVAVFPFLGAIGQPAEVTRDLFGYWASMSAILVPFTAFYVLKGLFDAIEIPWVGVCIAFVAVVLNVPANYLLIYGVGDWHGLGLIGAGLASVISESCSLLIAIVYWRIARGTVAARQPVSLTTFERRVQIREGIAVALGYVGCSRFSMSASTPPTPRSMNQQPQAR